MERKLLDQARVASPCNVSWNSMEGDERVRHCGLCKHNVYNVSEMSAGEAEQFLKEATGRTCVRMYKRADGTVLTRDCPIGLAAVRRRIGYAAAVTAVMVFSAFSMAMARVRSGDPDVRVGMNDLKERARTWPIIGQLLGREEPAHAVVMGKIAVCPPAPSKKP